MAARTTYEPLHTDLDPTLDFGLLTPSSFSACRRRGQQEETDESGEETDESEEEMDESGNGDTRTLIQRGLCHYLTEHFFLSRGVLRFVHFHEGVLRFVHFDDFLVSDRGGDHHRVV